MKRSITLLVLLCAAAAAFGGAAEAAPPGEMPRDLRNNPFPTVSGPAEFRDEQLGTGLTECPQAGEPSDKQPKPLDRRDKDDVEKIAGRGDDRRANDPDYSCFPQNETSVDVNPTNFRNVVTGQNDYRLGWGTSGINASTDNGNHWHTLIAPFPSLPSGDNLDGGGDPAIVFDRAGIVYYAEINFNRTDDTNGIWVLRSTNGGFTWSRPCVAIDASSPPNQGDDQARCGGPGDPRRPGDGTVVFEQENEPTPPGGSSANFSVTFHDKEYIAAGPRPAGVGAVCFAPETSTPIPAGQPGCPQEIIGVDRLYVTWTAFNNPTGAPFAVLSSTIEVSYSDDQGRSWSPRRTINGGATFCVGATVAGRCDDNQFSVPTVNPTTGHVYVAFENFDTTDENQILSVRSRDGGNTWEGPFFVTTQYDVNMRLTAGCVARGANRVHLTNSCFRAPGTLGIVADRRGGEFADDLYLVMWDNRNGTRVNTNADVFFFTSKDGGSTWIGPTRVNDDPSTQPANRDCGRNPGGPEPLQPACPANDVSTGNDQWWPWIDINLKGDLNIIFHDRRLDTDSVAHEWPTDRLRPGNYLVWTFAAQCTITTTATVTTGATTVPRAASQCLAPAASPVPQPTAPVNPSSTDTFPAQTAFPFDNFPVSDVPSNFDYTFRAGIFAGDYNGLAVADEDSTVYGFFTDARNGRSSRNQPGRNPACEQSDVFIDSWSSSGGGNSNAGQQFSALFLVTPCPTDIQDKGAKTKP